MYAKMFFCFKVIYPKLESIIFEKDVTTRMSPILMNPDKYFDNTIFKKMITTYSDKQFQILYNDLLWISVRSKERTLVQYLENLEKGNQIYLDLLSKQTSYEELTQEKKI